MTESKKQKTNFAGTYFDRDSVLRLARWAEVSAWIILIYHVVQALLPLGVFLLQVSRGLVLLPGFTDWAQQIAWMLQPIVPGLLYFIGIQAIGKALLIFMDVEDNTRRAARK
jgi:hypothetical protein